MISDDELAKIDPGIRRLVALLNKEGFETTDSGDGVSKPEDERVLNIPHVFIKVDPHELIIECDRLAGLFKYLKIPPGPCQIEGSYDPIQGDDHALIQILGVSDEHLGKNGN